ncbi:CatB-related O-acetyltransferase [Amaricoccus sp.]|uniref:CatB-related O-acetyltransferase n=1 Tax=Amaricoccus sp. TaxID=1872485 RepID=UPI0025C0F22B|nr:CatB-related O-acetyltransferase [Amaricoccus sp.]
MPSTAVTLAGPALAALDKAGLRLPGLRQTGRMDAASRIEWPTSIISTVPHGAFIDVGAFCNLSGGTINNARFGRYCSVASGVTVGPHEHPTDWLTTSRTAYFPQVNGWDDLVAPANRGRIKAGRRPFAGSCPVTTFGPDVWIGQGAFIKAGVTIGAGAIIGARATVLRDVPPYAIVVGTPGRVLRLRFPEAVVERLLALEWWRFSIYDLFEAPFDAIETTLDVIEARVASGDVTPWQGRVVSPEDLCDGLRLAAELTPALAEAG